MRRFLACVLAVVLSISALLPASSQAETKTPAKGLELTQIARLYPRHTGATVLWINFDGWRDKDHKVHPFTGTTGNVDRDIQDILFKTSQVFAPFDVEVRRAFGNGGYANHGGATTIFVGGDEKNVHKNGVKFFGAVTPSEYSDFPGSNRGADHRPNSDPFDIAFVDPMEKGKNGGWAPAKNNAGIVLDICHEAGHTFGLAHVSSSGQPDLMSYDSDQARFVNRVFAITTLNWDDDQDKAVPASDMRPMWNMKTPTGGGLRPVMRQNSYTYLTAVLGSRSADGWAHVADRDAVDAAYRDGKMPELQPGYHIDGSVRRIGQYDVCQLKAPTDQTMQVEIQKKDGSKLDPVLLVYDAAGKKLLGYHYTGKIAVKVKKGQTYKLVVGARNGATTGAYVLTVTGAK